jgi:hypothetical protein
LGWGRCEDVSGEHPLHPLNLGRLIGEHAARHLVNGVLFTGIVCSESISGISM